MIVLGSAQFARYKLLPGSKLKYYKFFLQLRKKSGRAPSGGTPPGFCRTVQIPDFHEKPQKTPFLGGVPPGGVKKCRVDQQHAPGWNLPIYIGLNTAFLAYFRPPRGGSEFQGTVGENDPPRGGWSRPPAHASQRAITPPHA